MNIVPLKSHQECFVDGIFSSDVYHETLKAHIRTLKKASGLTLVELRLMAYIKHNLAAIKSGDYKIWNYEGPRRDGLGTGKFTEFERLRAKGLLKRGDRRYSLADFYKWSGKPRRQHQEYFWELTPKGWQFFEQYPELAHPLTY